MKTLAAWQTYISKQHQTEIELGLDRVKAVARVLGLLDKNCPIVVIAGTNGKGTTTAALEAIYLAAGFKVGAFTSPYLFRCNEQIRIQGEDVDDQSLCDAFEQIEKARADITLTPFEFLTLAALCVFKKHGLDILLLEVGLGGRLDAVNIMDADVTIVTSIAIDHTEWLGTTRDAIGFEKAGIFRQGVPAICGDIDPPMRLVETAQAVGAVFYCLQKDFFYREEGSGWSWSARELGVSFASLPATPLHLPNLSCVLMAISLLQTKLSISDGSIREGLRQIRLRGRFEVHAGDVTDIFDVAHNPASVGLMGEKLARMPCLGKTRAVFSMLADKDMLASIQAVTRGIDAWYVAPLSVKRAASKEQLAKTFHTLGIETVTWAGSIEDAYTKAHQDAQPGDRIIVFGSFYTVSAAFTLKALAQNATLCKRK